MSKTRGNIPGAGNNPLPRQPRPRPNAPTRPAQVPAAATPHAPPVYRPQPTPKVLQLKSAAPQPAPFAAVRREAPRREVHAAQARPQAPRVAQSRAPARQKVSGPPAPANAVPSRTAVQRPARTNAPAAKGGTLQRLASKVVQATKLYPNLHPGAVEPIEPGNVYKLSNFADQYRLRKTQSHGVYVPNQLYNFVRTSEGQMLLHNRYRHPSIAEGRQVLYAGEVYFNNGKLEWWSNGSGHYQPDSEDASQAALPMDNFYSYQQVIKGEHKRKKS